MTTPKNPLEMQHLIRHFLTYLLAWNRGIPNRVLNDVHVSRRHQDYEQTCERCRRLTGKRSARAVQFPRIGEAQMSRRSLFDKISGGLIKHDHNHDGIDRRGFLK